MQQCLKAIINRSEGFDIYGRDKDTDKDFKGIDKLHTYKYTQRKCSPSSDSQLRLWEEVKKYMNIYHTHTQVREHFRMKAEIKVTQKASWTVHVIPVTLRRHAVWWFSVTEILTLSNVMWGTVQGVLKRSRYNLIYPYFFQNIYHINMYGTIYILRLSCSGSCLLI